MKAPAEGMDVRKITRQEPKVYLVFHPTRPDETGMGAYMGDIDPLSVAPGIVLIPSHGNVKYMEEQRFDRYNGVHRPKEMGQSLTVQTLFFVYEDGVRLPGFVESAEKGAYDMTKISDGTGEGVMTLMNWMDDFKEALLSEKGVPGTDLFLNEAESQYGLIADQKFVTDRRPIFAGLVTATFQCHADEFNEEVNRLLR